MYESWVVDELGYEIFLVSDVSNEELNKSLDEHPEWKIKTICIE